MEIWCLRRVVWVQDGCICRRFAARQEEVLERKEETRDKGPKWGIGTCEIAVSQELCC